MEEPEYIGLQDLSIQQVGLVLEITREVALENHGDMEPWHDSNPKCQVRGIQVGWVRENGVMSIVTYRSDIGVMLYPEHTLDPGMIVDQIHEWIRIIAPIRETTVNLPARATAMPGYVAAMTRAQRERDAMARREVQMELELEA